jgi:hypothetical protein
MSHKRTLPSKTRKAVEDLFDQGVTEMREVVDRLDGKVTSQQAGGLFTLYKRRLNGTAHINTPRTDPRPPRKPAPRAPVAAAEAAPPHTHVDQPGAQQPRASDPFDFGQAVPAAAGGLEFGQPVIEYHIRRIGPLMAGFLGVQQGDPISEHVVGSKYGGGEYEVIKYVNGNRVGYPRRAVISEGAYGPPKNPRMGSSPYPRLRAAEDEPPDPRDPRARHATGAGELNETVQAFKAINEIVKENKPEPKQEGGVENRVLDRALDVLTDKAAKAAQPQQGQNDHMVVFFQQQEAKRESERRDEVAKWERERGDRERRWDQEQTAERKRREDERAEAKQRHDQEMERQKTDFAAREAAAKREAEDREKRDTEYRKFVEKLEQDREARLQKSIEETQGQIAAVQVQVAEEAKKEREHQQELAKANGETLRIERERLQAEMQMQRDSNERLHELQKTSNQQMFDLQMRLASAGGNGEGTKMIVEVVKDALTKADARAHEITEVKKLEKLIQTVGPENAKALAMSLMTGGSVDLASIIGGRKPAAQPANGAAAADGAAVNGTNGAAAAAPPQGGLMNGIAQTVIETPFFRDLVEIWGNHLRKRNAPFLFANVMAGYMLDDRRVELFYNWMAGEDWPEILTAIRPKIKPEQIAHFETPEAEAFFKAFVEIIAKRIERDHVQGGIVPTPAPGPAEARAP